VENTRHPKQFDWRPVGRKRRRPGRPQCDSYQSWGRNRSFIGLTSWPEEEEEEIGTT